MKKYSDHEFPEFLILRFCGFFALSIPTRYYIKRYKSFAPYNLFLVILGVMFAVICELVGYKHQFVSETDPYVVLTIFLPFFYVPSMYEIEFFAFIRSLPQTLIITFLGLLINVVVMGALFSYVLHYGWSLGVSFIAALVFIPIQPSYIIEIFKELAQYNYLSTFLEAESLLSNIPVFILFKIGVEVYNHQLTTVVQVGVRLMQYMLGGAAMGLISGKITSTLMYWLYGEPYSALCVSVGVILTTFYLLEFILTCSGTVALVVIMMFVSYDKHKFSTEVDQCFRNFWRVSAHMVKLICLMHGVILIMRHLFVHFKLSHIYGTVIAYFAATICRICAFLVMGLILNKMSYEMNVRCLMLLAWSGVKGVINLLLALTLINNANIEDEDNCFLMDVLVYTIMSLVINSCSMRATLQLIGFSEDSPMRKTNMINCIKFIMDKRLNAINILKQDRYLMQTNWSAVREQTTINYHHKWNEEDLITNEINQEYFWKMSRTSCIVCQTELPLTLKEEDLKFIVRESQVKIWKAKKVSIIKQYEKGTIDNHCLQSLLHMYDMLIDRSKQKICAVNLKNYFKRNLFLEKLMSYLRKLAYNTVPEPPVTQFGRLCYYTMMHITYDYILFLFVMYYTGTIISYIMIGNNWYYKLSILVQIIFFLDFLIKVFGYSKSGFCIKTYFKYKWNIFDFFFLLFSFLDYILTSKYGFEGFVLALKLICLLRILKFFHIIQPIYKYILKVLEYRLDSRTCFGYDLAVAVVQCNDEILNVLHQIIGSKFVMDTFRKHIMIEKRKLLKQLEVVQKERPWIAITVKTKQAIRTTLNSMENALNKLKLGGYVDNVEYGFIWKQISHRQKILRNMRFITPSSKVEIFYDVPWIAANKTTADFLHLRAKLTRWEAGEVLFREGDSPNGVYILLSGMLRLYYIAKPTAIDNWKQLGMTPNVDHITAPILEKKSAVMVCTGDTVGLIWALTGRPFDCSIYAESDGEAYILTQEVILNARTDDSNQIDGLEARMWKDALIDMAVSILINIPTYQSLTTAEIKLKLTTAFVPTLKCYKMFIITESMDEVLLMQGVVADYHTNATYVAPIVIPRTVQKLILPTGSMIEGFQITTKLMILPTSDISAFEIMEYEKEVGELVSFPSDSCFPKVSEKKFADIKRRISMRRKSVLPNSQLL